MRNIYLLLILMMSSFYAVFGQSGIIRGSVIDGTTSEYLPMVKIQVEGLNKGAFSDLDGKFEFTLPVGMYNLIFSTYPYNKTVINGVEVTAEKVTLVENTPLEAQVAEFGEVTVQAEYKKNTENAILRMKLKSANMIDGISASNFRKTGDSDAASAMRRVPGVSIAGGKYVFIRGIGDRYNKTILNGLDIPGLDPDRNTLQMDIFPTSLIDNMIVNKTFSAELPADFTGGLVNIELVSFPNKKTQSISFRAGYNPNFHLRNDYLDYQGGKLDFLGFDDGTREIPAETNIPSFVETLGSNTAATDRYADVLNSFNKTLAAKESQSFLDGGLAMNFGNQIKKEKRTIAYNFLLNYRNNTEFYRDAIFGRYGLPGDPDQTAMDTMEYQRGDYGVNTVMLSTLAGFAVKTLKAKYSITAMHLQNGESSAGIFDFINNDEGAYFTGYQHNLSYSQKSLSNLHIAAKYKFEEKNWDLEWKVSPTFSRIKDPDIRFTRYENINDGGVRISSESGFPERIWRDLSEINGVAIIAGKKTYTAFGNKAYLKIGTGYTYKQRDFSIKNFQVNVRGNIPLTGDPDELFQDENLWPYLGNSQQGTTIDTPFLPNNPNTFNSNISNASGYVSNEMTIGKKFKSIVGIRAEYYTHKYTGQDQLGTNVLNNEKVLENLGIFPALNLVYSVTENQNFRFAYGKTIARPSFKELSYAEIFDPITGRTFVGGLFRDADNATGVVYWDGELTSTDIHNLDFRWEVFPSKGRTVSISAFYKKFINPIEIIQYATQPGAFQPRNVGDGQVLGGEFEIRENLSWISKKTEAFDFVLNVTVVDSRIELSKTEYDSRVANARTGQVIETFRKMAGQAPYIVNGGFSYNGAEKGFFSNFQAGLFYNVQGETLQFAGIVDRPDIYTVPFHSLNFNINKSFGKDEMYSIGIRVSNCLNDRRESIFKSFNAEDQYFSQLSPGVSSRIRFRVNL